MERNNMILLAGAGVAGVALFLLLGKKIPPLEGDLKEEVEIFDYPTNPIFPGGPIPCKATFTYGGPKKQFQYKAGLSQGGESKIETTAESIWVEPPLDQYKSYTVTLPYISGTLPAGIYDLYVTVWSSELSANGIVEGAIEIRGSEGEFKNPQIIEFPTDIHEGENIPAEDTLFNYVHIGPAEIASGFVWIGQYPTPVAGASWSQPVNDDESNMLYEVNVPVQTDYLEEGTYGVWFTVENVESQVRQLSVLKIGGLTVSTPQVPINGLVQGQFRLFGEQTLHNSRIELGIEYPRGSGNFTRAGIDTFDDISADDTPRNWEIYTIQAGLFPGMYDIRVQVPTLVYVEIFPDQVEIY